MTDPNLLALAYFASGPDIPWAWDGGDVLAWKDGDTIAFRPEVEAILRRLAPHGLPPFGALVLLLAACRDKAPPRAGGRPWRGETDFRAATGVLSLIPA